MHQYLTFFARLDCSCLHISENLFQKSYWEFCILRSNSVKSKNGTKVKYHFIRYYMTLWFYNSRLRLCKIFSIQQSFSKEKYPWPFFENDILLRDAAAGATKNDVQKTLGLCSLCFKVSASPYFAEECHCQCTKLALRYCMK